jgi:hypothetical protein
MATLIMNMGDYAIEREGVLEHEYGAEVLDSGWNPAIQLARQEQLPTQPLKPTLMPADLAALDLEQFMRRMYVYLSYE